MVIINDTNIWIDLKLTNIIEKVFLLPYELAVPDIWEVMEGISNREYTLRTLL